MINALTIDVEDYFQVNAFTKQIRRDEWHTYPLRVSANTHRILDMLDEYGITATFFILGWVAERDPELVKEIHNRGHEIACHGYGHQLVYDTGPVKFREDVRRSKQILEAMTGKQVKGYRAPSYSITSKSLWALEILIEEGYSYDSSIFPIFHDVYGIPGAERFPHKTTTQSGSIAEFPISTYLLRLGSWQYLVPVAGGGYLRLFPASLIRYASQWINMKEKKPTVLYFHPWEIDPEQPRISAPLKSTLRHYVNIQYMLQKVRYMLTNFNYTTMNEVLINQGLLC